MYTYKTVGTNECGKVSTTPRYRPRPYFLKDSLRKVMVLTRGLPLLPLRRVATVSTGYNRRSAIQENTPEAMAVIP